MINITTNIGDEWRPIKDQRDIFGNIIEDRIYNNRDYEEVLPPAELLADYHKRREALDKQIDDTLAEIQRILGIEIDKEAI